MVMGIYRLFHFGWDFVMFSSLPICPIGKGRFTTPVLWGWPTTQHPTLERWDWQQFVSHVYSQPVGWGYHMPHRYTQDGTQEQSEQSGAVEGRLYNFKRMRHFLVRTGRCDWFIWIICGLAGNGNLQLRDKQVRCLVLLIRRVVWLKVLIHRIRM